VSLLIDGDERQTAGALHLVHPGAQGGDSAVAQSGRSKVCREHGARSDRELGLDRALLALQPHRAAGGRRSRDQRKPESEEDLPEKAPHRYCLTR
jgi:hypothetical protein